MARLIGVTGSFGSGKSAVAGMLGEMLNAEVIDADKLARQAVEPGQPALEEIQRRFGPGVIAPDGRLDRKALAEIVFNDRRALDDLNAIVHPRVREQWLERLRELGPERTAVLDIPLLFEAGLRNMVDRVVVVTISEAARFARLKQRGFTEPEIIRRLGMQMPQARKAALADKVIDNAGPIERTRQQIETMTEYLLNGE